MLYQVYSFANVKMEYILTYIYTYAGILCVWYMTS